LKVIWAPTARRQALAAVDYIAADRPLASQEWLEGLVQRIDLASDMPDQGRVVPEWHEATVREVFHEPYRVIYEVRQDHIEILTLCHFRQELHGGPPGVSGNPDG
jgi:plasmid stabilization system protein ParE